MLLRYYQGHCNKQEQQQVEAWLQSPDDLESDLAMSPIDAQQVEERIWSKVKARNLSSYKNNWMPITYYAAAACVILTIASLLYRNTQTDFSAAKPVSSVALAHKQILSEISATALGDSSRALFQSAGTNQIGTVSFCGALRVTNNSSVSHEYLFESSCETSPYTHKRAVLKPGKTYFVLHNFYKTHEVIVMSKEQMQQFPDAFTPEIQKALRI